MPHVPGVWSTEFSTYVNHTGVGALDTLRWATRHMAELLQMEGEVGTVAKGALADLVVLRSDPSDDISILADPASSVLAVLKDGSFCVNRLPTT